MGPCRPAVDFQAEAVEDGSAVMAGAAVGDAGEQVEVDRSGPRVPEWCGQLEGAQRALDGGPSARCQDAFLSLFGPEPHDDAEAKRWILEFMSKEKGKMSMQELPGYEEMVRRFVEGLSRGSTSLRERAARAAAEGEIARNLSGKRTVDGAKALWKVGTIVLRRRCKRR